jgi:hypothetical protein
MIRENPRGRSLKALPSPLGPGVGGTILPIGIASTI